MTGESVQVNLCNQVFSSDTDKFGTCEEERSENEIWALRMVWANLSIGYKAMGSCSLVERRRETEARERNSPIGCKWDEFTD